MSSLKDIMDVDVEPLESQAYRRSREAAQEQASLQSNNLSSESPSPPPPDDDKKKSPIKRRISNRVSKQPDNHPITSLPNITSRRTSAGGESMDFSPGFRSGGPSQASAGSPGQSSMASEHAAEMPVKYTPVTGRISRAKKGVPVHTCDICRPVKTFTRAEHLRRHQLSHQKPAYECTFEDCERAFHRPDLLARHVHRHETQGEKAYRSGDSRSRASSITSEGRTTLKVETLTHENIASANENSPTNSMTPRTSASGGSSMTASSSGTITSSFQAVNFPPGSSHKRSASQAHLVESDSYSSAPSGTGSSRRLGNYDHMASTFPSGPVTDLTEQVSYAPSREPGCSEIYSEEDNSHYSNYTTPHPLPLLRIPEEPYLPGLSYTQENSPWCSSASDSTFSTQSDGSRNGRQWLGRGRSVSIATVPDWSAPVAATQWPPQVMRNTSQDLQILPFESIMGQFETPYTSPRMTPPTTSRQLLDVPNAFGGYFMELVGTPALSTCIKPLAQLLSASPSRVSELGLGGIDRKELVAPHQLGILTLDSAMTCCHQIQRQNLEYYISRYWQYFDQLLPIIHRPTFNAAEDTLLNASVAAIGTQYVDSTEARQEGMELNEYCKKSIDLVNNWTLHTMQAILLTEIFTRFRGKRTTVRSSRKLDEVFSRLLNSSSQSHLLVSNHIPRNPTSVDSVIDRFGSQMDAQNIQHTEWIVWVENEARQRLLNACFVFDIHQAILHEQVRSKLSLDLKSSILYLPCPEIIWAAGSAAEWHAKQPNYTFQPLHIIEQNLSPQYICGTSPFTQSLVICFLTAQLPPRDDPTYPNDFLPHRVDPTIRKLMTLFPASPLAHTYLALYHTPLHDLLAIAGDTWVFGRKITPPSAFHAAQSRLKSWSSSLAAAEATQHACHVISWSLAQQNNEDSSESVLATQTFCISDYWSLYTAALTCWAFGHRYQTSMGENYSSTAFGGTDIDDVRSTEDIRHRALTYTKSMIDLDVEDLLTSKASMRGDTSGVIDAVRARLQTYEVGRKCMMLVDTVNVLNRLKEAGRGKWF